MGSPGADVHVLWSLLVPAHRENIYQNGTLLPCFHYAMMYRMEKRVNGR